MSSKFSYKLAIAIALICLYSSKVGGAPMKASTADASAVDSSLVNEASGSFDLSPSQNNGKLTELFETQSSITTMTDTDLEGVENEGDDNRIFLLDPTTGNQQSESLLAMNIVEEARESPGEEDADKILCASADCTVFPTSETVPALDDQTVTSGALDTLSAHYLQLGQCINWYKSTKVAVSTDVAATFDATDVVENVLKCQNSLDAMNAFTSKLFKFPSIQNMPIEELGISIDMQKPAPEYTEAAPTAQMHDEAVQLVLIPFAFDLPMNDPTAQTIAEGKEIPEEQPIPENLNSEFASVPESMKENGDIKDFTPATELEAGLPSVAKKDLSGGTDDELDTFFDYSPNGNEKNRVNPLYIFPFLFFSFILSILIGSVYNRCRGIAYDETKILKVPRMGVCSDVPTLSALSPAMRAKYLEKMGKKDKILV